MVQRADEVAVDETAHEVVRQEREIEGHAATADLGEGLGVVVERRQLDGHVVVGVLLLEALQHALVDVVRVVVDAQGRIGLGLEARGDRLVAGVDRPLDGVLRRGDGDARRARRRRTGSRPGGRRCRAGGTAQRLLASTGSEGPRAGEGQRGGLEQTAARDRPTRLGWKGHGNSSTSLGERGRCLDCATVQALARTLPNSREDACGWYRSCIDEGRQCQRRRPA